jgi:CDP-glucose 4,6-dehydratase
VFHLAAQALVLPSYERPLETLSTNIMGTAQLLDSVRRSGCVRAVVNVTTDKCYENPQKSIPLHEGDALGGHDPYSASKAAAEIISAAYRDSFLRDAGIAMATARAGNVIGGGDFADHRLIPDMVRAIEQGTPLLLRQPKSIRPWQHVLDVLHGYLLLGQALFDEGDAFAGAFNFAPDDAGITAADICRLFQDALGMRIDVVPGDGSGAREAGTLRLNADKAKKQLGWRPRMNTSQAVLQTALWYREYLKQPELLDAFTASQLMLFGRRVHDRFMVTKYRDGAS